MRLQEMHLPRPTPTPISARSLAISQQRIAQIGRKDYSFNYALSGMRLLNEPIVALRADQTSRRPALFVDLDGALVRTDTLLECAVALFNRPWRLARALCVLAQGKARMKQEIAAAGDLDPTLLPYNEELLSLLRAESARGRFLVLATGADRRVASAVADHLRIFDAVLASDGKTNLTGRAKLAAIRSTVKDKPFAYVGNDRKDLAIWREARSGIVVNAAASLQQKVAEITYIETTIAPDRSWPQALLRAIRPYQWSKNLLVFVPVVTARAIDDLAGWGIALLMFIAFSCAASGTYLINDLMDLAADRLHPRKRLRPLATGSLPLHIGLIASPLLLLSALGLGMITGSLLIVVLYVLASVAYSLYLKSRPLIDVFLLAALYTMRLFGGGEATGHPVSLWLLTFSGFLFLSLAIVKRVCELVRLATADGGRAFGRGYQPSDAGILQLMGVAASFVASMVLALYVQSELSPAVGRSPTLSWALVPLILFWQCRIWLATARGNMHDDPIIFAARDWVSWLVAGCSIAALLFGRFVSL